MKWDVFDGPINSDRRRHHQLLMMVVLSGDATACRSASASAG